MSKYRPGIIVGELNEALVHARMLAYENLHMPKMLRKKIKITVRKNGEVILTSKE